METCEKCENHYKETPRGDEEVRLLVNRLNRIMGQFGGIKR